MRPTLTVNLTDTFSLEEKGERERECWFHTLSYVHIWNIYWFNMNLRNIEWKCRRGKKKFGASIFLCQCRNYTLSPPQYIGCKFLEQLAHEPVEFIRTVLKNPFTSNEHLWRGGAQVENIFLFLIFHKYCRFRACRRSLPYWSPRSSSAPPPPKNSILSNRGRLSNILHETFHNEKKKYFSFFEKKFAGRRREERTFQLVWALR